MFREAKTVDADFAIGAGIVHEIRDIQIPVGAPVFQLVFQRYSARLIVGLIHGYHFATLVYASYG